MRNSVRRTFVVASVATGIALAAPLTALHAQSGAGPRWQAWLGCWAANAPPASSTNQTTTTPAPAVAPLVCVTPTADANVVEIVSIAEGKVVSRDRIDASGRSLAITAGGCNGSARAAWSADERRVYLKSNVTCEGLASETSAILAMSPTNGGEWLDVRSVSAGGNSEVRVARYHDAGIPSGVPSEIANALNNRNMATRAARLAAVAPIGPNAIIEATHSTDPTVIEAWISESGQTFPVDARSLRDLADAGVPGRVTDAMVASSTAYRADQYANQEVVTERVVMVPAYDPWGYSYYATVPVAAVPLRYQRPYAYAPYGFGFGLYGFGYAPYGYGYVPFGYYSPYASPFGVGFGRGFYGRGYYPPVVVVRGGHGGGRGDHDGDGRNTGRTAHPRAVNGQGYTHDQRAVGTGPGTWNASGGEVWNRGTAHVRSAPGVGGTPGAVAAPAQAGPAPMRPAPAMIDPRRAQPAPMRVQPQAPQAQAQVREQPRAAAPQGGERSARPRH
jgi:hypothetical protein